MFSSTALLYCCEGVKSLGISTSYVTKSISCKISSSKCVNFFRFTNPEIKFRELLNCPLYLSLNSSSFIISSPRIVMFFSDGNFKYGIK